MDFLRLSLKNFFTVNDLLSQGISGVVIRYFLLSTHYRKPLDFNQKAIEDAKKTLEKFHQALDGKKDFEYQEGDLKPILEELSQDLNISKTIAYLHELSKEIKSNKDENLQRKLFCALEFLGFFDEKLFSNQEKNNSEIDEKYINSQIELRLKFKQEKNFQEADRVRKELLEKGIILEDVSKDKTLWKVV